MSNEVGRVISYNQAELVAGQTLGPFEDSYLVKVVMNGTKGSNSTNLSPYASGGNGARIEFVGILFKGECFHSKATTSLPGKSGGSIKGSGSRNGDGGSGGRGTYLQVLEPGSSMPIFMVGAAGGGGGGGAGFRDVRGYNGGTATGIFTEGSPADISLLIGKGGFGGSGGATGSNPTPGSGGSGGAAGKNIKAIDRADRIKSIEFISTTADSNSMTITLLEKVIEGGIIYTKTNSNNLFTLDENGIEIIIEEKDFYDLNDFATISTLKKNPTVLKKIISKQFHGMYVSDLEMQENSKHLKVTGVKQLGLNPDGSNDGDIVIWRDPLNTKIPEVKYEGIPKGQLVLPKDDMRLRMLDQVKEFTLYSNTNNKGIIKIIYSVNQGKSWKSYKNGGIVDISTNDLDTIKEHGMTPDEFNAIKTKWNDLIIEDNIRFGYYLEIEDFEDTVEVDKLEALFSLLGRWKKLKETDYDYEYDNTHIYITLHKDGSYKINYQE